MVGDRGEGRESCRERGEQSAGHTSRMSTRVLGYRDAGNVRDMKLTTTALVLALACVAGCKSTSQAGAKLKLAQKFRRAFTEIKKPHRSWQLLLSGPGLGHRLLKNAVTRDVAAARTVKIICAYFLPSMSIRRELRRAARSGRTVQLILAGQSDIGLSRLATHRLYTTFLKAGVDH